MLEQLFVGPILNCLPPESVSSASVCLALASGLSSASAVSVWLPSGVVVLCGALSVAGSGVGPALAALHCFSHRWLALSASVGWTTCQMCPQIRQQRAQPKYSSQ